MFKFPEPPLNGTSGAVDVTVTTAGGTVKAATQFTYTPAVLTFAPPPGELAYGLAGQPYGEDLSMYGGSGNVTYAITSGSLPVNLTKYTQNGQLKIDGTPQPGATNATFTVTGTDALGQSASATYTIPFDLPMLTGISPNGGPEIGNFYCTLYGTNFPPAGSPHTGIDLVLNGNRVGVVGLGTTTQAGCQFNKDLQAYVGQNTVGLRISTSKGSAYSNTVPFTIYAPPNLFIVSPATGALTGGNVVTITGSNLTSAQSVTFGGVAGTGITVDSAGTSLTVTTPAFPAPGAVDVKVTTIGGTATGSAGYTYVKSPTITSFTPATGSTSGGTQVTINGTSLAGATVRFGANAGTVVSSSATAITVKTPPVATAGPVTSGPVDVTVTTAGGTVKAGTQFTYTPAVLSFTPATLFDAVAGQDYDRTVTMSGGFGAVTYSLESGTLPDGLTFDTAAGRIFGTVATTAATGDYNFTVKGVDALGQTATKPYTIRVKAGPPTISSISPPMGSTTGGDTVTISGTSLAGATVKFGMNDGMVDTASSDGSHITVKTPASGMPGAVDVSVTTPGGNAVKTGGFTYVAPPAITSVSPAYGSVDGGYNAIIGGTNLDAVTKVIVDTTETTTFTHNADGTITVAVPAHAAGSVDVKVSGPGGMATSPVQFTYVDAPTISMINPAQGATTGGDTVTLTGTHLDAVSSVSFDGTAATSLTHQGTTGLTVTTPVHAAGAVAVVVTSPGGVATKAGGFTYVSPPAITAIDPAQGSTNGGDTVTISGTNLDAVTSVTFDGTAGTSLTHQGTTGLTVTTPVHAAGAVAVVVTSPGGTATSPTQFTYVDAPSISMINPAQGSTNGGDTVTLTGTHLDAVSSVSFDGTAATSLTHQGTTGLTVTTPVHAAGAVAVVVTSPGGVATKAGGFTYVSPPAITAIDPAQGSTNGGDTVTISGTNLDAVTSVTFDGTAGTSLAHQGTTGLTVTTPAHQTAGAVAVAVTSPVGMATSPTQFTYVTPPTITSITPDKGSTNGGDTVTIKGSGFSQPSANPVTVTFGGAAGTSLNIVSDSEIVITTPNSLAGAGSVDVKVTDGNNLSATLAKGFTYVAPPVFTGFFPLVGRLSGGDTFTIYGANLDTVTSVSFGGKDATSLVYDSATSQITVKTPDHMAGVVPVTITSPGGMVTHAIPFTYLDQPTITSITPNAGKTGGDETVKIVGTNFGLPIVAGTVVAFDGTAGTFVSYDSATGTLTEKTPAHQAGAVNVSVTTYGGTATSAGGFTYVGAPTIGTISPKQGSISGGTQVTITGTNLDAVSSVSFDGTAATSLTHQGTTGLTVTTPVHAAGAVAVVVTSPGGTAVKTSGFTYVSPVLSFTPAAGQLPDATVGVPYSQQVTMSGGFGTVTYSLDGGTALPAGLTLDPATGLISGTPTATGTKAFTIRGTDASQQTATVAYTINVKDVTPTITSITPDHGLTNGDDTVTLTGTGLANPATVAFGLKAGTVTSSSDTKIVVTTPANGTPGPVDVTVTAGGVTVTAPTTFTYEAPVLSFTPAAGKLPDATVGQAYSQQVTLNGGLGTVTYSITGPAGLPSGLTLSATGLISGTLSMNAAIGDRTFTIRGTDTLGQTASMNYTITVKAQAQPAPVITALSVDHGPAAGGTQLVLTGINFTGADRVSFGTVDVTNLQVDGPGTHVTVTSPQHAAGNVDLAVHTQSGQSNAVTYGFDASTLTFTPPGGALPVAFKNKAYSQQISVSGGMAPYTFDEGGKLPDGVTFNDKTGLLSGTPTAASVGDYSFDIEGIDAGGMTQTVSYTLKVADAPVTVPGKTVAVVRGQAPPPVDLTNGASGGPFTAAAIVSVTPPQAGTATIMSDVPPQKPVSHASPFAGVHSFTLVFKPDPAFAGKEAKVTYRLTSAAGISGEGVVTYRFNAKPSVSSEEVSRVEQQVHGFVQARLGLLAENIDLPGLLERRQRGQADGPVTTTMTPSDTGVTLAYSTSLSQIEAADKAGAGGDGTPETLAPLDFWSSGKVLLTRGATGTDTGPANAPVPGSGTGSDGEKWGTFALFSAGVDYLVSDRLLVGFSVHYDHESDPLDQGTLITGNGWLAGPYASLQLAPHVFFDTSLLYGQSANSFTSTALKGDFDTTRWLWSGTLKGDMAFNNGVSLTPRLKAVYLAEKAGAYSAEDKDGNAYPLDAFTERQIRLSIGAEIRKQYELANGVVLTPSLDAEAGFAGLDGGGAFGTLTAGLEADTPDNWQFYAGLLLDLSADGTLATGAKATAGKQF